MQSKNNENETERRIASPAHNDHIRDGIAPHRRTAIAPDSLLTPLPSEQITKVDEKQRIVRERLLRAVGKPFAEEQGFLLYQGDCAEVLTRFEACGLQANLTVTSPPYNIGKEYETTLDVDAFCSWCADWMQRIYACTTGTGAFWLNLGYFEVPTKGLCVPIPYLLWDKSPFYLLQEVVWQYGAGVSAKRRLSPRNEKWLYYVKDSENYTFNLDAIRDPNVKYPNQKKNGKFRCNPLGKNPSDVWTFPKVTTGTQRSSKERTGHPAQFPLGVVERIVKASSNPTDVVLDPFAGSCSAGVAATGLGRVFVGVELRTDYCELSAERMAAFRREQIDSQRQAALL